MPISGQVVILFLLSSLDGPQWPLSRLDGKPCLLAFFRFASSPFCNLHLYQLISRLEELPDDFTIVAVFESSLPELQRYAKRHDSPFPNLADEDGLIHGQYGSDERDHLNFEQTKHIAWQQLESRANPTKE